MKANRTNTPPPTLENLGDGTYYYNFQIVETTVTPEEGEAYQNFDYQQVRCHLPVDEIEIQTNLDNQGYDHIVNIGGE